MIGIVDYGAGNLRNVQASLSRLGTPWRLVTRADDLEGTAALILPGVGQFGAAARRLREAGLFEALRRSASTGRPLLGICLGMQLLFERSEEDATAEGLGLLSGEVLKLQAERLPHIGWALVEPRDAGEGTIFRDLSGDGFFAYFAHSYAVSPSAPSAVAWTSCPPSFASAIRAAHVWGVQFHPEKSGADGQRILARFVAGALPRRMPEGSLR